LAAVVSNPPYIASRERGKLAPEVRDHEPAAALFARESGMAVLRSLIARAARLLPAGGLLALEIGEEQGARVRALLGESRHWANVRIERDLAGKDRYALARRAGA
jgi:release factor glutamine methyltransferase